MTVQRYVFFAILFFAISWTQNHVNLETFAALLWNLKWFEIWARMNIASSEGIQPIDSSVINLSSCSASYRFLLVCIKEFDDINNLLSVSTIQSWDTYTSTKYLPLMFASFRRQPCLQVQHNHKLIHNHVSWNISDFKHTIALSERPSPPNIRTATKVIIVIKNDIEKEEEKKKSIFTSSWNHCKCFTRTQFLHWLTSEHHWKK